MTAFRFQGTDARGRFALLKRTAALLLVVMLSLSGIAYCGEPSQLNVKLIDAAKNDLAEDAKFYILKGADIDCADENGMTPLLHAVSKNHIGTINALIAKGANVRAKDRLGWDPLIYAISNNQFEIASVLLDKGADPDSADESGVTPLMLAAMNGGVSIAGRLLKKGAAVDAVSRKNMTAVMYALENGHTDLANLLIEEKADMKKSFFLSVALGRTEIVKTIVGGGMIKKIDASDENGKPAGFHAVAGGGLEMVKILLALGYPYYRKDDLQQGLLFYSVIRDKQDIFDHLVKNVPGASSGALDKDANGCYPIFYAAANGNNEMVETLIKYNSFLDATDKKGLTAIDYARSNMMYDTVRILERYVPKSSQPASATASTQRPAAVEEKPKRTFETKQSFESNSNARDDAAKEAKSREQLKFEADQRKRLSNY